MIEMKQDINIYKKLLDIQKQIKGLGKDGKGDRYTYVTGNKILSFVRELMNKNSLILKQEILSIDNTRQDYKIKYGEKSEILTKVLMRFTWVDCETGATDVNLFGANGQNDWEKGLGSALTYAERYFLLKYFHIPTDEDDIDNPDRKKNDVIPSPKLEKEPLISEFIEIAKSKKNDKALEFSKKLGEYSAEQIKKHIENLKNK